jgi:hypothetical protein
MRPAERLRSMQCAAKLQQQQQQQIRCFHYLYTSSKKGKGVPLHAMKAPGGEQV